MKAKEWAAKFSAISNEKDLNTLFQGLVKETMELISKRGGSDSALEGVVREQHNKIKAIERHLGNKEIEDIFWLF